MVGNVTGEVITVVLERAPQFHTILAIGVIRLARAPVRVRQWLVGSDPFKHSLNFYVISAQPVRYVVLIIGL